MRYEESLIYFLLEKLEYVTANEIAEKLSISTKTVYRLIRRINEQSANVQLILTEKGKGIKINYEVYLKNRNKPNLEKSYSPTERRMQIIQKLLFESPQGVDCNTLFEEFFVSTSVIQRDEDLIAKTLEAKGLKLIKEKNKRFVRGPENIIRRTLSDYLLRSNMMSIEDLLGIKTEFNKADYEFILLQLENLETVHGTIIPYPYNINMVTHLYILMKRVSLGIFDLGETHIEDPISILNGIKENIEQYLGVTLPNSEMNNILLHLISSRIEHLPEKLSILSKEEIEITNFFLSEFQTISQLMIRPSLIFDDLACHIKPMLNRLKNNIAIKNNLLEDTRKSYKEVFDTLVVIAGKVSEKWRLAQISDDEIGFITLYFAQDIEAQPQKVRVLLICTTGLGTFELLKIKLQKSFPDIEVDSTASIKKCTLNYIKAHKIDLILSTIKVDISMSVPLVLVSSLFIQKDQDSVKKVVNDILWKRQNKTT